ncbi:MAG TPA: acyl-CoA synthetase FdrA [Ktedonobacteraceae bacterium]|nr:acyl-CoA synthetase FdrA [Ktedonobacteraceae bacterium]
MHIAYLLKRHTYHDSITLMVVAQAVKEQARVDEVGVVMASEANRLLLQESGIWPAAVDALADQPGPDDLLIVVRANDEAYAQAVLALVEQQLASRGRQEAPGGAVSTSHARSLEMALRNDRQANLALISVAGEHAWLEAEQALRAGLHVFLFSDNVSIAQERRLKTLANSKGLLLMGPDCGTAIINGVGLGFSNVVPRDSIGIVGATGTGMQQLSCLIASAGLGVSQAIGVGGRDLSEAVGGIMMRRGLALLTDDPQTEVIVLVAKPSSERVVVEVLQAAQIDKPVVAVFLGAPPEQFREAAGKVALAQTLTEGAELAVALAGGDRRKVPGEAALLEHQARLAVECAALSPSQRYIRALYSGGTLCYEAMYLLSEHLGAVASNIPLRAEWALAAGETFRGHTALDMGEDQFTKGKPHPMIDPSLLLRYVTQAAHDQETAVILLDIVLGYCAHPNPAGIYAPVIARCRDEASAAGRRLPVIVSLCGTEQDLQQRSAQRSMLEAAGALVFESNVAAARAALTCLSER